MMVVHYKDLGVPDPKGWNRAHAKCSVYEYNTSAGSFYYQVRKYIPLQYLHSSFPSFVLSVMLCFSFKDYALSFFFCQPMLDYIEKKRFSGEDSHTISARKMMAMAKVPVELPNALDFSRRPVDDLPNANLNLDRTVGGFNAIQMKQRNVDRSESGVFKNIFR